MKLFNINLGILEEAGENASQHEKDVANRRLRFAANRIGVLGFREIHTHLTTILCKNPWWVREHLALLENLARQGYTQDIWTILDHHITSARKMADYMSAIALRALRFVPRLDVDEWTRLANYAFDDKEVIQLMASETWLLLSAHLESVPDPERVLECLQNMFTSKKSVSRRLLKITC